MVLYIKFLISISISCRLFLYIAWEITINMCETDIAHGVGTLEAHTCVWVAAARMNASASHGPDMLRLLTGLRS